MSQLELLPKKKAALIEQPLKNKNIARLFFQNLDRCRTVLLYIKNLT